MKWFQGCDFEKMNLFFLLFVLFILVHLISTGSESDCGTNSCCFLKKLLTLLLVTTLWWQFQNVDGRIELATFVDMTFIWNMSPTKTVSNIRHQHQTDEKPFYHVCQEWLLLRHNQQRLQPRLRPDLKLFDRNHWNIFEKCSKLNLVKKELSKTRSILSGSKKSNIKGTIPPRWLNSLSW